MHFVFLRPSLCTLEFAHTFPVAHAIGHGGIFDLTALRGLFFATTADRSFGFGALYLHLELSILF